MAPNLICLGVEKCGTTSLHRLLDESRDFYVPAIKEVFFFNKRWEQGNGWYENLFSDGDECKFRCDITPSYFRHDETLERIAAYAKKNILSFIFVMRNPVYRAYSHYVHDIDRHHGLSLEGYSRSFFEDSEANNSYHFTSYKRALDRIIKYLGSERLLLLTTEEHIRKPAKLSEQLAGFLGTELHRDAASIQRKVANTGRFPHYLYGGSTGLELEMGADHYFVPPGSLAFCSSVKPRVWPDINESQAQRAILGSANWTREVDAETFRNLHNRHFIGENEYLESTFGLDVQLWQDFHPVSYQPASPPEQLKVG